MDPIGTVRLRWWHGSFHNATGELVPAGRFAVRELMKPWRVWSTGLILALSLAVPGCSSLESDTTNDASTKTPVPGEVNPNAPDASQNVRTSPGWNF